MQFKPIVSVLVAITYIVAARKVETYDSSPRHVVSFNFGWKFRLGLHHVPKPLPPVKPENITKCKENPFSQFTINASGFECFGLTQPHHTHSKTACAQACCAVSECAIWQWSDSQGCWVGSVANCNKPGSDLSWTGGRRPRPDPGPGLNPNPGPNPAEAQRKYDDSEWKTVQLPHDGLISQAPNNSSCPFGCSGRSYIPRHVMWYRKTFKLPKEWSVGDTIKRSPSIWLDFGGIFRVSTVYVNGVNVSYHICGYTGFQVQLETSLLDTSGGQNTIAVFVDPDNGNQGGERHGSGWWYEGGGIYRNVNLIYTPSRIRINDHGLFVYSNVTTAAAVVHLSLEVIDTSIEHNNNLAGDKQINNVFAKFSIIDTVDNQIVGKSSESGVGPSTLRSSINITNVKRWTTANPNLYKVVAELFVNDITNNNNRVHFVLIDKLSVNHGFRTIRYDANKGFFLNEEHFKVRGFCDHNNFGAVGMAVPDRLNLYRAQASRAVGGNGRRTSHNPPNPEMLEIYDRLGVVVMDENRLFANYTPFVENMAYMVKRDRNHPSVVIWSFCNEAGCEGSQEEGGPRFREAAYALDGTRPTLANMFTFNDLLSRTIDVQGFSHKDRETLNQCHAKMPNKPIYMSECCSCNTMRDEDVGCESSDGSSTCVQKSFNADCVQSQTNASNGIDYAMGTMVWTLFDYYGEPSGGWPHVTSTFGQFDLSGFPKAAAYWYKAHWLYRISDGRSDKTFKTRNNHFLHIVESWESPAEFPAIAKKKTRNITIYTDVEDNSTIELFVNGKSQGGIQPGPVDPTHNNGTSWTAFQEVKWEPGNLTVVARDSSGTIVAKDERFTSGKALAVKLSLDVPSVESGTGSALVLDGQDSGLLRASIVDSNGHVVHMATNNVTFRVTSGPGKIVGTNNGDPACHLPNHISYRPAYHGLARAVVKVTSIAALRGTNEYRLMRQIDTILMMDGQNENEIVVEAVSPGLQSSSIRIPVTTDISNENAFEIARKGAGKPVYIV